MSKVTFGDNTNIYNYGKPYIIAEVNSSHNGNIDTAKEMIKTAQEIGCDCVKFQSWSAETLYSASYYKDNPIALRIVKKFSFDQKALLELSHYCAEVGVSFASTPYSRQEVDFLVEQCDVPFIKIASMEINNHDYLTYIAHKQRPIILSTGMASMEEIEEAVKTIEETGNKQLTILHCVSIYPAPAKMINLNNITTLQEKFPHYPIGYSDHTIGAEIACGAVALGAAIIEKHFTLDNSKMGMDNNMATEPGDMKVLIESCHNVYHAMGSKSRIVSQAELEQRHVMRRSIIVTKDMKKGDVLNHDNLGFKRPGTGFPPGEIKHVIGKTLTRDIQSDTLLLEKDIV